MVFCLPWGCMIKYDILHRKPVAACIGYTRKCEELQLPLFNSVLVWKCSRRPLQTQKAADGPKRPLQSTEPPKALQKTTGKSLGSGYVRQAADQQLTQRRSPTTDSHGNSWLLGYPPWPSLLLIMQPDHHQLPDEGHVDASLSADALSMWIGDQQWIPSSYHPSKPASK